MEYSIKADAGSSKTNWVFFDAEGREQKRVRTSGINAALASNSVIDEILAEVKSHLLPDDAVTEVEFYGAGCATPQLCAKMERHLERAFGAQRAVVASDLLGAARWLLGSNRGIACILGTGSNSCLYDGRDIVRNVPSLGYVLGDEGSGNAIGRRLLSDAFKGRMPAELADGLMAEYDLDLATVIEKVYRQPAPNRFLASLAPFAARRKDNPYIREMLLDEFGRFLDRNVLEYCDATRLPVCFTGGIAFNFADILQEACEVRGLKIGKITAAPL